LDIINKLTTPDELSGLLNLSIDAMHRLLKQKNFSTSKSTEDVKKIWLRRSDSFSGFVSEYLVEDYEGSIPKQVLRHAYTEYCRRSKLRPANDKEIKDKLATLLGAYESKNSWESGRVMTWQGINWKDTLSRVSRVSTHSEQFSYIREGDYCQHPCHPGQAGQVDMVTTNQKEDFLMVLDFIESHPMCRIHEMRTLNVFNLEQVLEQLKKVGKISEPRCGQFNISIRMVE